VFPNLPAILFDSQPAYLDFRRVWKIVYSTTLDTTNMLMIVKIRVKTSFFATGMEFPNGTGINQQFQIAIDRAQADLWKSFSHNLIHDSGGRVGTEFLQLFQDHLSLFCHSLKLHFNRHTY